MVMSWKELLLICVLAGATVIAYASRHFVANVLFIVNHVVAAGIAHTPGFLHFVSGLVR